MSNSERPLSPHLQIYKPQMTSVLSILHRMTGVALVFGTFLLIAWVIAAATSEEAYDCIHGLVSSTIGMVLLFGWTVSLFFHLFNGIRHLFWDMGYLFKLQNAFRAGWVVLFMTAAFTGVTWYSARGGFETGMTEMTQDSGCEKLCSSYSSWAKDFRGNRTCTQLCIDEGACALPHVACTAAPKLIIRESGQ